MNGTVIILAIGDSTWGQMALNLALSVKANEPFRKILLIHDGKSITEIESVIDRYFDYTYLLSLNFDGTANAKSFYVKTMLYDIATKSVPNEERFIFIDADCLLLPSQKVGDWFRELYGNNFVTWCNDVYDFSIDNRTRSDYTFWIDPKELNLKSGKMPQINSSFIYFEVELGTYSIFLLAHTEYQKVNEYKSILYKGAIPDELCFNLACLKLGQIQSQVPYYPIFFQFANEYQAEPHIQHHYKAIGFAGTQRPSDWFIDMYNRYANYYREYFGVRCFDYSVGCIVVDEKQIYLDKKLNCIAKAGDLSNSNGGAFNPDGIMYDNEISPFVIVRKEKDLSAYKKTYTHNTALPHIFYMDVNYEKHIPELDYRIEDFRLFKIKNDIYVNFTCVSKTSTWISFALLSDFENTIQRIDLPIKTNKVEKNWLFFYQDDILYCIYSLSPYVVFEYDFFLEIWFPKDVDNYTFNWFHKGQNICNSSNPIDIGDYLLSFFHTKERGIYFHGAVLIDKKTLNIKYATNNSLHIMDNADGLHKGLIYVSGSVFIPTSNIVRVYFGEGDWNAWEADFDRNELVDAIIKNSNEII